MKRFQGIFIFGLLLSALYSNGQSKWDGEANDAQWNTALNWVGDVVPGPLENVLLDNSAISGTYTVDLPVGLSTVTVKSLTITPATGNTILVTLPLSNTAATGFATTNTGDALVLNNGGIFKNSTGGSGGNTVSIAIGGFLRINSGGKYIHNTPSAHATFLTKLSSAPGTENGTFVFDIPSGGGSISLNDRIFGNLLLSGEAAGGKSYLAAGSLPLNVKGNFILENGATYNNGLPEINVNGNLLVDATSVFSLSTNTPGTKILNLKGNCTIDGILSEQAPALTYTELVFMGVANQDISINGSFSGDGMKMKINNLAGVTLQSPVTIPYRLDFTSGNINASPTNPLIFDNGTDYTGGSSDSHVNGPVRKIGDEEFTFPVGEGGFYAPVYFQNVPAPGNELPTDVFSAEYIRSNPMDTYGNLIATGSGLDHISQLEYWDIKRLNGTAEKYVWLTVGALSQVNDIVELRVSLYNGTEWDDAGIGGFLESSPGPPIEGSFQSGLISSFGPMTFASTSPSPVNPLPVDFINFTAEKKNADALLNWKMGDIPTAGSQFVVERSLDKKNFESVGTVSANNSKQYQFTDKNIPEGIIYYRIRLQQPAAGDKLTNIASVINNHRQLFITSLFPNPVTDRANLLVSTEKNGNVKMMVFNMSGQATESRNLQLQKGSNTIQLNFERLPAGAYQIVLINDIGEKQVTKFIKN